MKVLQNKVERAVYRLAFAPDGRRLVAGGSGGFDVWDLAADKRTHAPSPEVTKYVSACECDPAGRGFIVSDGRGVRRFAWAGPKGTPFLGVQSHAHGLAVAADAGRLLLSRSSPAQLEC